MAFVGEAQVKTDINNNDIHYCYIVFGEDRYLKKRLVENLSCAVTDKDDFFNFQQFDNDSSLQEVYDSIQQYPMMSDKKCVILKDYDFEACDKKEFEKLIEICSDSFDSCLFILWFDFLEFDSKKSDRFKKLCAATEKGNGRNVNVSFRSVTELAKMLTDGATKRGCVLKRENAVFMVEMVGTEIETLKNELEKVCAFANKGEITRDNIKEVCIKTVEQSVYNLSSKVLNGDISSALKVLDELFYMRVTPMVIFYTISGVYVDLSRAYAAKNGGVSLNDAVKDFAYKNKAFLYERAVKQVHNLNRKQIFLSLNELMDADRKLKSYSADARRILEETIVRLSFIAVKGDNIDNA